MVMGTPQTVSFGLNCCCTGTGTGTACDCGCCASGYWSEYTIDVTAASLIAGIACILDCPSYEGTFILKKVAGLCKWVSDELIDVVDCFGADPESQPGFPKWRLTCEDNGDGTQTWILIGGFQTVQWNITVPPGDFCVDGGTLSPAMYDTTAACTSVTDIVATPTGVFIPC